MNKLRLGICWEPRYPHRILVADEIAAGSVLIWAKGHSLDRFGIRPYPRKPQKRLEDDLTKVTICIAVAAECYDSPKNPKLVLVSDRLLSLADRVSVITSTDTGFKLQQLATGWFAMYAGEDISYALPVIDNARTKIGEAESSGSTVNYALVMSSILNSFKEIRQKQAEDTHLGILGWTVADLATKGKKLPRDVFALLFNAIQEFDLGCEFLVCGFPSLTSSGPEIFSILHPGRARPVSGFLGYSAIGSGAASAVLHLSRKEQKFSDSLAVSVYNAVCAKVIAQSAGGIGPRTIVGIYERGTEKVRFLMPDTVDQIKEIWQSEEAKYLPQNLEKRITDLLDGSSPT